MNIYFTDQSDFTQLHGAVLAIGNFDGVHLGHHVLLEVARKRALALGVPCAVLTFEPHPRVIFRPLDPPFRLTPLVVKAARIEDSLIDHVICIPFSTLYAEMTAEDFMRIVLQDQLKIKHIVVGHDFHFGHARLGTPEMLKQNGFSLTTVDLMKDAGGLNYSSTRIRNLLMMGDMDQANACLGWEWYIEGMVIKGDQRGRLLGYPTANVNLGETLHPAYGVYASEVQIEGEDFWRVAATNIGIRPMFEVKTALVEAHILDFNAEIYGKNIRVKPIKRLRGEMKFADLNGLKAQMAKDCEETARILLDRKA